MELMLLDQLAQLVLQDQVEQPPQLQDQLVRPEHLGQLDRLVQTELTVDLDLLEHLDPLAPPDLQDLQEQMEQVVAAVLVE
jgi:hypothetical protein